jgi:DNA-binding NarL/FixJ family response regulator
MSLDEVITYALGGLQPKVGETTESVHQPRATDLLSTREMDVLRLIVDGRSNQEIGEALFISPHTVANHVASIFNKLGVDSRTAAATHAVRSGIL